MKFDRVNSLGLHGLNPHLIEGAKASHHFFSQTWHFDKIKNTHTGQIKYQEFEQKNVTFHHKILFLMGINYF